MADVPVIPFNWLFEFFTQGSLPSKFANSQVPQGHGALVHAEFSYFGVVRMVELGQVDKNTLVIDLGCGRGSALLLMQALTGCVIGGIEIQTALHQDCIELSNEISKAFGNSSPLNSVFINADLTDKPAQQAARLVQRCLPLESSFRPSKVVVIINNQEFHQSGQLVESIATFIHALASSTHHRLRCLPVTIFHLAELVYGPKRNQTQPQQWLAQYIPKKVFVNDEDKALAIKLRAEGRMRPELATLDSFVSWTHSEWMYKTQISPSLS